MTLRHLVHRAICWYLRHCGGAFHCYVYGPNGRYVVLMNEGQYHDYRSPAMNDTHGINLALAGPAVGKAVGTTDSIHSTLAGVDVHGGLRVRLEYDTATRTIEPRYSAESGADPTRDVASAIDSFQHRLGYLEAWAAAYAKRGAP